MFPPTNERNAESVIVRSDKCRSFICARTPADKEASGKEEDKQGKLIKVAATLISGLLAGMSFGVVFGFLSVKDIESFDFNGKSLVALIAGMTLALGLGWSASEVAKLWNGQTKDRIFWTLGTLFFLAVEITLDTIFIHRLDEANVFNQILGSNPLPWLICAMLGTLIVGASAFFQAFSTFSAARTGTDQRQAQVQIEENRGQEREQAYQRALAQHQATCQRLQNEHDKQMSSAEQTMKDQKEKLQKREEFVAKSPDAREALKLEPQWKSERKKITSLQDELKRLDTLINQPACQPSTEEIAELNQLLQRFRLEKENMHRCLRGEQPVFTSVAAQQRNEFSALP